MSPAIPSSRSRRSASTSSPSKIRSPALSCATRSRTLSHSGVAYSGWLPTSRYRRAPLLKNTLLLRPQDTTRRNRYRATSSGDSRRCPRKVHVTPYSVSTPKIRRSTPTRYPRDRPDHHQLLQGIDVARSLDTWPAEAGEQVLVPHQDRVGAVVVGLGRRAEGLQPVTGRDEGLRLVRAGVHDEVRVVELRVVPGDIGLVDPRHRLVGPPGHADELNATAAVQRGDIALEIGGQAVLEVVRDQPVGQRLVVRGSLGLDHVEAQERRVAGQHHRQGREQPEPDQVTGQQAADRKSTRLN